MKQEIDNNAMWAAFRQELALQGELHVVTAIDNALNNLGFTIEETSTIISIPLKQDETSPVLSNSSNIGKVEQKPAWSEEDEERLQSCLNILQAKGFMGPTDTINTKWLKSLKDRVQPKREWSEEDKRCLTKAISACEHMSDGVYDYSQSYIDAIKWLKSLRPQSHWKSWSEDDIKEFKAELQSLMFEWSNKKDNMGVCIDRHIDKLLSILCNHTQSHWKPSEGQLECLGYAIEKAEKDWSPLTNNRIYLTLKALKEQLLELRGSKV